MNTTSIARDWAARGYGCDTWIDPPGQAWRDYVHSGNELLMLIDGEIEIRMNGEILHPPPGVEVFIPAGVPHTVINTGTTVNRWLYGYRSVD